MSLFTPSNISALWCKLPMPGMDEANKELFGHIADRIARLNMFIVLMELSDQIAVHVARKIVQELPDEQKHELDLNAAELTHAGYG